MLLHFWLDLAGRSESGVRALSLLFALLAIPVAFWAGPADLGDAARRAGSRPILMAFNPFLAQYAQEARMYSMVALLAIPATTCFIKAYALDTRRPQAVDRGLRDLGRGRALHAQLADLLHARAAVAWVAAVAAGRQAAPQGAASATACWASAALFVLYLPWVPTTLYQAAHTGAPWADAPALGLAARRPERAARADAADRAADLRRRGPARAAAHAAARRARPRGAVPGDHRGLHADDRLDAVAGLTRLGEPLPRGRAAAVPAARRGRPGARAAARHRRPGAGGDHVGAGRRAGGEVQRPRDRPRDRARASRPATW